MAVRSAQSIHATVSHAQVYYYTAIRMKVERIKWQKTYMFVVYPEKQRQQHMQQHWNIINIGVIAM